MSASHYQDDLVTLHHGDCLATLRTLPDASVDAVVTDPPYGLSNTSPQQVADTLVRWVNGERDYLPGGAGFMGKAWDAFVPPVAVWDECLRVLKPGGHVLAFAGSRTHDLMTLGLRLAGFDIRDSVAWLYGSGFPKSLDVARAIDAHQKHGGSSSVQKRRAAMGDDYTPSEVFGQFRTGHTDTMNTPRSDAPEQNGERTPDAERWQGWGTALKPAFEPVVVARKPLAGTVAANVLAHGTGALNVDGCRVDSNGEVWTHGGGARSGTRRGGLMGEIVGSPASAGSPAGRWPANVVLDESQAAELDQQSGEGPSGTAVTRNGGGRKIFGGLAGHENDGAAVPDSGYADNGGASRFFYVAKADASERVRINGTAHPTVKPLSIMRWLVRLVTPPGGTVLEPFAGSGTTVEAAILEGFRCIAVEREADYLPLIVQRIHRRRNPVEAVKTAGEDAGLFDLLT